MSQSTETTQTSNPTHRIPPIARSALFVIGAVALLFGVAVLVWPVKAAMVVAALIAVYAIVAGVIFIGVGIFIKHHSTGARIGQTLLGVLYVAAGIIALASLQEATAFLAVFIAIMIGMLWIVEGFVSLTTLGSSGSKALAVVFAILSIIAGVVVVTSPLWSAVLLWWLLGISMVVMGVTNIARAALAGKNK